MLIIWNLEFGILINAGLGPEVAAIIVRISLEREVEAFHLEKVEKAETDMSFRGKSSVL